MNKPKRHHFLPISYLDGFTQDDKLWVFDREKKEYRQQHPINTAVVNNLNTYSDQDGETQTIEPELSIVEGNAKVIIKKLEGKQFINITEKETLSLFVSLLSVRVPIFRQKLEELGAQAHKEAAKKFFATEEKAQEIINRFPPEKGTNITATDMVQFVHDEEYLVVPNENDIVTSRIPVASEFANRLKNLNWLFIYSPKKEPFITTDNPFTMVFPYELQIKELSQSKAYNSDIVTIIPLSRKLTLIINSIGVSNMVSISKHNARLINIKLIENSHRFIISYDEDLLKHLVNTTGIS